MGLNSAFGNISSCPAREGAEGPERTFWCRPPPAAGLASLLTGPQASARSMKEADSGLQAGSPKDMVELGPRCSYYVPATCSRVPR